MDDVPTVFIFGYGSLILPENRTMTLGAEVEASPTVLSGFERSWGFSAPEYHLTTVSLRENWEKSCTGVLFPVTLEQLEQLDLRETGYERIELSMENICCSDPQFSIPNSLVYTYVTQVLSTPSKECPIVQSDVDVILTGCITQYGVEFARELVRSTNGWHNPWIDDRNVPRYPWPLDEVRLSALIDQILKEIIPTAYDRRKTVDI